MKSSILVTIQISSILAIIVFGTFPSSAASVLLLSVGSLLGITSLFIMQFDNLRIFPEPKKDIRLVTSGPYKYLRHPMYTSVLLIAASFIIDAPSVALSILWLALLGALLGKISIEERLLPLMLPEYILYQQKTWKLIPFIF